MSQHEGMGDFLVVMKSEAERAEEVYCRAIVLVHDEYGWTFREIGACLGIAHSWVYKLYKKSKSDVRQE